MFDHAKRFYNFTLFKKLTLVIICVRRVTVLVQKAVRSRTWMQVSTSTFILLSIKLLSNGFNGLSRWDSLWRHFRRSVSFGRCLFDLQKD